MKYIWCESASDLSSVMLINLMIVAYNNVKKIRVNTVSKPIIIIILNEKVETIHEKSTRLNFHHLTTHLEVPF